jgi:hypothetical protein
MPVNVPDLPPVLAYPSGALVVYRWCVLPAARGTVALLREWRRYRAGE